MMYRISVADGPTLGYTEKVRYIKISESGAFIECPFKEAVGLALKSTPYNLLGKNEIPGAETAVVWEEDLGEYLEKADALEEQTANIENAMCENDEDLDSRLAEIENALCELDERG
jgi:hypothetical protein